MPHAGGRVGRGIYLADCQAKSASYVQPAGGHAVMFLVEAALGSQHVVDRDGPHASGLVAAPAGFDSVLAKGQLEPDPSKHATLALGGRAVVVPQGALTASGGAGASSSFTHNEYLIYKVASQPASQLHARTHAGSHAGIRGHAAFGCDEQGRKPVERTARHLRARTIPAQRAHADRVRRRAEPIRHRPDLPLVASLPHPLTRTGVTAPHSLRPHVQVDVLMQIGV
jgi:hypothetical protein